MQSGSLLASERQRDARMENKVAAAISLALFSLSLHPSTPLGPHPRRRPFIFKSPPLAKRAGGRRVFLSRRKITHCPVSGASSFLLLLSRSALLPLGQSAASLPTEIKAEEVGPRKRRGEKIKEKGRKLEKRRTTGRRTNERGTGRGR